jgi:hypothetical protein
VCWQAGTCELELQRRADAGMRGYKRSSSTENSWSMGFGGERSTSIHRPDVGRPAASKGSARAVCAPMLHRISHPQHVHPPWELWQGSACNLDNLDNLEPWTLALTPTLEGHLLSLCPISIYLCASHARCPFCLPSTAHPVQPSARPPTPSTCKPSPCSSSNRRHPLQGKRETNAAVNTRQR